MPIKRPIVEYSNGQHQFKVPFIMYADFESILEPIQGASNNPNYSSTRGVNVHTPSGWCLHSKFAYGDLDNSTTQYRGSDCVERFCEHIISEAKRLYTTFPERPMVPLTKSQLKEYRKATKCHICFKELGENKVRDHCHYSGLYRGATHTMCNLRYKIPKYIPVVFHNLAGYDAHLFIRELAKHTSHMGVIAKNVEDYISFSIKVEVEIGTRIKEIELRFIDSFKFMSSSLDSLVNNSARGDHEFWGFEEYSDKQCELLIRKGIYPYEYMSSWDKFNETSLPSKGHFYSNLYMSGVGDKEYEHARNVWREFKIRNMGEYHDLYLKTDTMLLANVFESFRSVCMKNYGLDPVKNYGLDPAHFYTAPGLAWRACLKKTGVKLELLLDQDMLLMFERGIRSGITQSVHRWAAANNPYMKEYDSSKPTQFLQYLDTNNLYGWAMSQPLPTGEFKWIKCEGDPNKLVEKFAAKKDYGYLLEVDVSYPKELHDLHNDLPFMCTKMKINGVEKLIPNLYYKRKYIIHIRALKQASDHRLVLERIRRCIRFKQSPWMKEYIDFNTNLRTAAKNDFEKDFYKLMNNSVFGKTLENIRRHRDIKLLNNKKDYLKAVRRPNFKSGTLLGPDLMGCEMGKIKVVKNKPVYLGQVILDLSKLVMYEFHYDYMLPKYGDNIKLSYMDTDSFVCDIETEDFYKDIAGDVETRFDTSGYCDRPLPVGRNKKVIGLMKDELGGEVMKEFVSLRPKMYSYRVGNSEPKKCKGIKKCVVKKTITFEDYKKCLFEGRNIHRSQLLFRSNKHEVKTLEVNKLALNNQDDKRLSIDGISSYAIGHYRVWGDE